MYFFSCALSLLNHGYEIEIILTADSKCKSIECLKATLHYIGIPLRIEDFGLRVLTEESQKYYNHSEMVSHFEYDVYLVRFTIMLCLSQTLMFDVKFSLWKTGYFLDMRQMVFSIFLPANSQTITRLCIAIKSTLAVFLASIKF